MRITAPHLAILALLVAGCSTAASQSPVVSADPSPTADAGTPALSASAVPSHAPAERGVVVTFLVAGAEEYRVLLTDPDDIAIAEQLLAGDEAPRIPSGVVVAGDDGGVNAPWSWHIDPGSVEFADMTIEVCDGRPSDVESGTITDERYCPWSAEVIAIEPAQ